MTATFYNFSPSLVAHMIPRAWTLASPEQVLAARLDAARASLTRLLGDGGRRLGGGRRAGRPAARGVHRADAGGPRRSTPGTPTCPGPRSRCWSCGTARRCCASTAATGTSPSLLHAGLTGLEALITHTATGRGFTEAAAKATRGWRDEEWAAGCAALADRGLLDDAGLTDDGKSLRAHIEAETDALSAEPWQHLGPERTARVDRAGQGLRPRRWSPTAPSAGGIFARG